MKPSETLRAAKELIREPAEWCHVPEALNTLGTSCSPKSPLAVKRNAVGAMLAVGDAFGVEMSELLKAGTFLGLAAKELGFGSNFEAAVAGHRPQMSVFMRAIELAEQEERES